MNENQKIDEYLKTRKQSLRDLETSLEGLYAMGVRFFSPSPDGVPEISAAQTLLPRFEFTLDDFEWKAIYDDGSELDQYGEVQSHFGNIDLTKLAKLQYISNFEIDTQNPEKRLIITLDVKQGTFTFWNCGGQQIKADLSKPVLGEKKIILFKRRRTDFVAGVDTKKKELTPTGERSTYTRYYLGYEAEGKKIIVCLYPNGEVAIDNDTK